MPELPEVETIRRDLQTHLVGQKITALEIRLAKVVRNPAKMFRSNLIGRTVIAVKRRGKLLLIELSDTELTLLVHLRMTGQVIWQKSGQQTPGGHAWPPAETALPHKYTHLILQFGNGGTLYYNDLRQFGFFRLVSPAEKAAVLAEFGTEPLDPEFTLVHFRNLLSKRTGPIKSLLLNQKLISGLGNIYADEVCWQAKVRPTRKIHTLTAGESKRLWAACRDVLEDAIQHRGTTFRNYRDANGRTGNYTQKLAVYGRMGEACRRCGTVIVKTRLAGRGTHYCPHCQK